MLVVALRFLVSYLVVLNLFVALLVVAFQIRFFELVIVNFIIYSTSTKF